MKELIINICIGILVLFTMFLFSLSIASCGNSTWPPGGTDNSVTGDVFTGDNITVVNNNGDDNAVGDTNKNVFLSVSLSPSKSGALVMCRGVSQVDWTAICNNALTLPAGNIPCREVGINHDPCPNDGGINSAEYCAGNLCQSVTMEH